LFGIISEGVCFFLDAISFVAIMLALLVVKISKRKTAIKSSPHVHGLKEGYRYAFGFSSIRYVLPLLALTSLMGVPYVVLVPIFARDVLHRGPRSPGFFMGASDMGVLIGALHHVSRKSVIGLRRLVVMASSAFGRALITFSFSRLIPLSLCIMLFVDFGTIIHGASTNMILQTIVKKINGGV
jgi:hypothetical protein